MKKIFLSIFIVILFAAEACKNSEDPQTDISNNVMIDSTDMACNLTSEELQNRKATVIQSIQKKVIEKKELSNGFAFRFNDSDSTIDELTEFIKTERACCSFFSFNLVVNPGAKELWLEITGTAEAKQFIEAELAM